MPPRGVVRRHVHSPPASECLFRLWPLLPPGGRLAPYLQLADPFLQGVWPSGDGGFLRQCGLEASEDPVRFLDLPLQTQGSLGSAAGEADGQSPPQPHPRRPAQPPLPRALEHSLLPVEVAENLHVTVLVLDIVEGHGQVQGGWARRPS